MKVNPWGLAPFEQGERSQTFKDDQGQPFTLTFRNTDGLGFFAPEALVQEWLSRFGADGEFPLVIPTPTGEALPVDQAAAERIAQLVVMQAPAMNGTGKPDPPYDLLDWLGFAHRRPDIFMAALRMTNELLREEQDRLGKSMTAEPAPSSAAS